jgi:hypothetical protein
MGVTVLGQNLGGPLKPRSYLTTAEANTYDANRLSLADLIDVTGTGANVAGGLTGTKAAATAFDPGWLVKYGTLDEKTVTSATNLGGCLIWSSLIPTGGTVGCASAGSSIAPFYQADPVTGAPNCAVSFIDPANTTAYVRSVQRTVISPPPEPSPAVAISGGLSRLSTLEIQPGGTQVTQMTIVSGSEVLKMVYSLPLSMEQHICRHVDATKCR